MNHHMGKSTYFLASLSHYTPTDAVLLLASGSCLLLALSAAHAFNQQQDNKSTNDDKTRSSCPLTSLTGTATGTTTAYQRKPRTFCEHVNKNNDKQQQQVRHRWDENNSFPNLTRHGKNSVLRQCLTQSVYERLRHRKTSAGVTLEDLIRPGVCLPQGYDAPHGGVYAGDAESYTVFAELLDKIIERHCHHKAAAQHRDSILALQRFRTNLNPESLLQQRLDVRGEYILHTRMRLARSVAGFVFTPCISRAQRRAVEQLVRECLSDTGDGAYISLFDMSNKQHDDLVRRQLLFPDPNDGMICAGLGRDWPDARGIYCDTWKDTPNLMIWCNAYDHIWIISNAKGGDVQGVFERMSKAARLLETSLMQRGYDFAQDRRLGFLNASPADIGTALRASVYIKLVRLGQQKGFQDLMKRLRLEARAEYSNEQRGYTGIFDIGNAVALGQTEVQLINIMIQGVAICIDLERRLENGETLDLDEIEV